ncbi:MAG: hypothetical protein CMJ72_02275 [Planctomycetaceae bacterium]|nr:hypothetical protein [Planctomycetaceae bacterium]
MGFPQTLILTAYGLDDKPAVGVILFLKTAIWTPQTARRGKSYDIHGTRDVCTFQDQKSTSQPS